MQRKFQERKDTILFSKRFSQRSVSGLDILCSFLIALNEMKNIKRQLENNVAKFFRWLIFPLRIIIEVSQD